MRKIKLLFVIACLSISPCTSTTPNNDNNRGISSWFQIIPRDLKNALQEASKAIKNVLDQIPAEDIDRVKTFFKQMRYKEDIHPLIDKASDSLTHFKHVSKLAEYTLYLVSGATLLYITKTIFTMFITAKKSKYVNKHYQMLFKKINSKKVKPVVPSPNAPGQPSADREKKKSLTSFCSLAK